jgi:hypothetical protein
MKVRITDVVLTDNGFYRLTLVTDDGVSVIELDRENMDRFMRNLLELLDE